MSCSYASSRNISSSRFLASLFIGLLFFACFGTGKVQAADEVTAHDEAGEVSIITEEMPDETAAVGKRPAGNDHQLMHGTIEVQGGVGEPAAPSTTAPISVEPNPVPDTTSPFVSGTTANPEIDSVKKRVKPKPDPHYTGKHIGSGGAVSAPKVKEKKHAMHKRGETTKARHVKSEVVHADSPELQAYHEKRQKIKEHFKSKLENRPERKAKKHDR